MDFIGRKSELLTLRKLKSKRSSSLVVCKGRRRIGKSRLIREFAKEFTTYLEFQGLPPAPGQTNRHQIDNFMAQLSAQTRLPRVEVDTWALAFDLLGSIIQKSPTLILLDEVSWMGKHDLNFAGLLKNFWDTFHTISDQLIVCLCGSVSTWIEENILNSTHFVGRVSLTVSLQELTIAECREFFETFPKTISNIEKLKYLTITGGIPKYLEELNPRLTFEENINDLAFRKGGFLVTEFSKLFNNSFDKEKQIYKDIISSLSAGPRTLQEVATALKKRPSGNFTKYLSHLGQAGFVTKDSLWDLDGSKRKSSQYRISDNYTRFYLRCVAPNIDKINQGIIDANGIEANQNWQAILGLQFENLVYANLPLVISTLGIDPRTIVSCGPYIQRKTNKNKGACQIDLAILTKYDLLYLCEIKFRKKLDNAISTEVAHKIELLQRKKYMSIQPVLIFAGELEDELAVNDFFYRKVDFGELIG